MAERVTMWKSKNGKVFESPSEAEQEDRAIEMIEAFRGVLETADSWTLEALAISLAEQGYRITNINPSVNPASA